MPSGIYVDRRSINLSDRLFISCGKISRYYLPCVLNSLEKKSAKEVGT
jgi:hypothetical protein